MVIKLQTSMKKIFTFEEFQKHLDEGIEIEKKQEPFKNWLVNMNNEFKDFIAQKYTKRTANKHSFIIECFIDFITYNMQLMDIQQITKGIANSYFQQWFASKIGANTKEEVKVAINKFIDFLAIEKNIVIENLQPKSKKRN